MKRLEENGGLWTNEEHVISGLAVYSTQHKKKEALKLQISFRNKVLGQKHSNKDVFKFSHHKKQFTVDELKQNLLLLIGVDEGASGPSASESNCLSYIVVHPQLLVGKKIRHCFQVGEKLLWYI